MKKAWKRVVATALTVSLISSFNISKITFAENIINNEIVINEENFPDKKFLNYIKEAGFDTDKNGKLSEEELSSVKRIGVKWLKIKSLKGIEYFKNLEHINAEMNYIEELDLSQNKKLISVYCNNNMLTSIKLPNESENYTLEYLDIFSNMLTQVDLHNLKGLTFLHIDDNRIEVLDLSDNPLTAGHGFVAQNNYMQKIILPNNGKEYPWVEYLGTQLFPKDKSKGYKVEWYLDEEKTQILDSKVTEEITLNGQTLYAEYVPIEYIVKFNPGIGLGESITQDFQYDTPQNLLKNQFTKEGYEFAGWKDINGKIYSDEAEVVNLTDIQGKIINLTATWQKARVNSEIKITTESLSKVYDGIAVEEPKVEKSGSTNKIVFTWYQFINEEWTKLSSAPINTGKYKVVASVAADENYKDASAEKEFEITKAIPQYDKIENLKAIYGYTLENVRLPEGFSWQEDLSTSVGNAGENKFKVIYTPKDTENYEVVENIEVIITVEKANNTWTIEPSIEGWKTGENPNKPVGQPAFGEVEFTYSNSQNGIFTKEVQTEAGTWYMKATVAGNENYSDLSAIKKFVISNNTNEWIEELSITNWTYGEVNIEPVAKSKYGDVEFTYSNSKDGIFTNTVPTNAGKWYVKASVKATENYTGLESIKEFEIKKGIPKYDKIENLKATYGDTIKDVKLPEGFSWQEDLSTSVGNAGENKFKVKYTPKDIKNYEVIENIEVTINVEKATNSWLVEPSIEGWKYGEVSKNPVGQAKFGEIEFLYSNSKDGIFTNTVPTNAGTWYVKASVKATENYTGLESIKEFEILKAIPKYEKIENLKATYGDTIKDVKLPEGFSWQEDLSTSVGNSGENKFKVKYTPKDIENYEVIENIEVIITVEKAINTWTIEPSMEGWKYGEVSKNPVGQAGFGEVEFLYSNSKEGIFTNTVPTNAGTWYVKTVVKATENYTGLESIKEFEILKAIPKYEKIENLKATYGDTLKEVILPEGFSWQEDLSTLVGNVGENKFKVKYTPKDIENYEVVENIEITINVEKAINTWTIEPSIEGWKYGEVSKNPVGQSKFGKVEFTYSNSQNGIFTKEVPTEAGTWYMKATVIGNENHTGLEKVVSFVIEEVKNDNGDKEDQETDDEITKPGEDQKPSEDKVITEVPTIKPNDKNNIIVNTEDDIKNVEVIIKDIEAIKNGVGSLNISINNNVEMNLPLSLIDKNLLEDAKDVSIKIHVIEDSNIIKDLKAINKIFDFNLVVNKENQGIKIHNFKDGVAEVTFELTDEDFEGLDRDKLKVYYYNEETKKFEAMETKVEGNNITFKTNHFSKYIIAEEIVDNNVEESNPDNNTSDKDEEDTNKPNTDNSKPTPDKDVTIETEEENLPQTGSVVSSTIILILALGTVLLGSYMLLRRKKVV